MEKWLEDVREAQRVLADKFAEDAVTRIPSDVLCLRSDDIDPVAYKLALRNEIEHIMSSAIQGYTDWLAIRMVRSNNFNVQPVPQCEPDSLKAIEFNYDVSVEFLRSFLEHFHDWIGEDLPLVGKISHDGTITPDEETLKKWADMFDWSQTP